MFDSSNLLREESKNHQGKKPSNKTCGISRTNSQVVGTNEGRDQRTHCHLIFGTNPKCIKISHVNCNYGAKLKDTKKCHINFKFEVPQRSQSFGWSMMIPTMWHSTCSKDLFQVLVPMHRTCCNHWHAGSQRTCQSCHAHLGMPSASGDLLNEPLALNGYNHDSKNIFELWIVSSTIDEQLEQLVIRNYISHSAKGQWNKSWTLNFSCYMCNPQRF